MLRRAFVNLNVLLSNQLCLYAHVCTLPTPLPLIHVFSYSCLSLASTVVHLRVPMLKSAATSTRDVLAAIYNLSSSHQYLYVMCYLCVCGAVFILSLSNHSHFEINDDIYFIVIKHISPTTVSLHQNKLNAASPQREVATSFISD